MLWLLMFNIRNLKLLLRFIGFVKGFGGMRLVVFICMFWLKREIFLVLWDYVLVIWIKVFVVERKINCYDVMMNVLIVILNDD